MKNLVSQLPLAHAFVFGNCPALIGDDLLKTIAQARNFIFIRGGINNEYHFVLSLCFQNLLLQER